MSLPDAVGHGRPQALDVPARNGGGREARGSRVARNDQQQDEGYCNLLVIFRTCDLAGEGLGRAIAATFHRRQTPLPDEVPAGLSDELGSQETPQRLWRGFLRRLQIEDAPDDFGQVVAGVRSRVWPAMTPARRRSAR